MLFGFFVFLLVLGIAIAVSRGPDKRVRPAKVIKILLVIGTVVGVFAYSLFRIERAEKDVERSRATAKLLVETFAQYQEGMGVVSVLAAPVGAGEVVGAIETLVDLANDGEIGRLRTASQDARICLADVERNFGAIDLLTFSQPTACRAMFKELGEPAELADAGHTFGDVAVRAATTAAPGIPGGPACRSWQVEEVRAQLGKKKKGGADWDAFDVVPEPYVELKIGADQKKRSGPTRARFDLSWSPKAVSMTPGQKVQLRVFDEDAVEDDFAFGFEGEVPTHLGGPWRHGDGDHHAEVSLRCAR